MRHFLPTFVRVVHDQFSALLDRATRYIGRTVDPSTAVDDGILGQFGLAAKRNDNARDLSQGERKLLDVALAYALKPKLLFLDEPTSGVSTRDKGQIMDTIASVVRGEGITAVIVEHDMDVVFKYSDRIVVMAQGAILAQGTPDEIRKNEQVAMILLGTSGPDAFTRKD